MKIASFSLLLLAACAEARLGAKDFPLNVTQGVLPPYPNTTLVDEDKDVPLDLCQGDCDEDEDKQRRSESSQQSSGLNLT